MIRQLSVAEFTGPGLQEVAAIATSPEALRERLGITWEPYEEDEDGFVLVWSALLETTGGVLFVLEHCPRSPRPDLIGVSVRPGNTGAHLDAALAALGVTSEALGWLADGVVLPGVSLFREDDNGARFHIGDFPCRADAEARMAALSSGGHKQHYFIEAANADPRNR